MIDQVEILFQDESGNWRTMAVKINDSQQIRARMNEVKRQFRALRVQAVGICGRFLDMAWDGVATL